MTSRQIITSSWTKASQTSRAAKFVPHQAKNTKTSYFNRGRHYRKLNNATTLTSSFSTFNNNNFNADAHHNTTYMNITRKKNVRQPQLVNKIMSLSMPRSIAPTQYQKSLLHTQTLSLSQNNFCSLLNYLHDHHHDRNNTTHSQLNIRRSINSNANNTNKVGQKMTHVQDSYENNATPTVSDNISNNFNPRNKEPIDRRILFKYLKLTQFSDEEMEHIFDTISSTRSNNDIDEAIINEENLTQYILSRIKEIDYHRMKQQQLKQHSITTIEKETLMKKYANKEAKRILDLIHEQSSDDLFSSLSKSSSSLYPISDTPIEQKEQITIQKQVFLEKIRHLATKIDTARTLPISISMLLVGSSVGIVIPIMPYIVSNLGLSAGQYGIVVSSFACAKLFANVPAAVMVEKHGRKPYLVYSLVIISMGVSGIGLASHFEHLVLCRLMTGIGVSALSTAATLTMADCSTSLNRASTMAPLMSSFAAGTAMGPVIGGVLADHVGIHSTFYLVGCIYLTLTAMNHFVLTETKLPKQQFPWEDNNLIKNNGNGDRKILYSKDDDVDKESEKEKGVVDSMKDAMSQWSPLLKIENVRNVVLMNGFYWAALSGSQMTLLPLILTDLDGLAFTATQVGQVYMGMSLVQVLGNPTMAAMIDKIGKVTGIVVGCTFLSTAMFGLPYCTEMNEVVGTCGLWALGSTMLSTAPVSFVSDNVSDRKRAQAIALFRTAGDVGFLLGAISTGAVADAFTMDIAVHSNAGMLLTATGWFTTRSLLRNRITT